MNVYTVTDDFFSSVQDLFKDVGEVKLLPPKYSEIKGFSADLIVFTGGEDINPKRYGEDPRGGHYNDKRDSWELKVFKDILKGNLVTKKTLGICRGLQLMNVGLNGTLVYDINEKFHTYHMGVHTINHEISNNLFSYLDMVNSMHHQALEIWGGTSRLRIQILAVESTTRTVEIAEWGNDFLGFQFHPEFFGWDNPNKAKIVENIAGWIKGEVRLVPQNKDTRKKNMWVEVDDSSVGTYRTAYSTTTSDFPAQEIRVVDMLTNPTTEEEF